MNRPSANHLCRILLALFLPLSILTAAERPLMTIAEARARLVRNEFQEPVRVRGTVTFSNLRLGIAYLQDSSGGIGFDPRAQSGRALQPGQQVEVEGILSRRQGMAMLLKHRTLFGAPQITVLPGAAKQAEVLPFELELAAQMRIDGMLTQVTGVVRRVVIPPVAAAPMVVEISSASGYVMARLPWHEPQSVVDGWINKPVTLDAVLVCRAEPPMLPQDADALLFVPSRQRWVMQPGALEQVFQRPPVRSAASIQVTQRSTTRQRLHLQGTVTAAKYRSWVCLRTEDGSIEVSTRQTDQFFPGQILSIACWPQMNDGRLTLLDGICRGMGQEAAPKPLRLEQGFFHPRLQRELVEVTGILHSHSLPGGLPRYTLSLPSGTSCLLGWGNFLRASDINDLANGSRVRLIGLCHILNERAEKMEGASLAILPRSMADVEVIAGPSWWTARRLRVAVWWLLGIVGLALPGALLFRWQLWRQTRRVREIETLAATEEERLRIAREFHDSLQQQLASAALHLETLRGALHAAPDMLPRLIDDTTAMLRHCQVEARHCIWDLRCEEAVRNNLSASIQDWLERQIRPNTGNGTRVEFNQEGEAKKLPEGVPMQLMRITQEAVTNALTHAGATCISIGLRWSADCLELEIEDDGQGFESGLLSHPPAGHYGLSGLKERAAKIGARLHLSTRPGNGTRVFIQLPVSSSLHETCV